MNYERWRGEESPRKFLDSTQKGLKEGVNGSKQLSRSVHHKKNVITQLANKNPNFGPIFSAHICELTRIIEENVTILEPKESSIE